MSDPKESIEQRLSRLESSYADLEKQHFQMVSSYLCLARTLASIIKPDFHDMTRALSTIDQTVSVTDQTQALISEMQSWLKNRGGDPLSPPSSSVS